MCLQDWMEYKVVIMNGLFGFEKTRFSTELLWCMGRRDWTELGMEVGLFDVVYC